MAHAINIKINDCCAKLPLVLVTLLGFTCVCIVSPLLSFMIIASAKTDNVAFSKHMFSTDE